MSNRLSEGVQKIGQEAAPPKPSEPLPHALMPSRRAGRANVHRDWTS